MYVYKKMNIYIARDLEVQGLILRVKTKKTYYFPHGYETEK